MDFNKPLFQRHLNVNLTTPSNGVVTQHALTAITAGVPPRKMIF
jgi:hypothetical protein